MKRNYLGIQIVAEITGISIYTLRAWEKRYQLLRPSRTPTGRRLYSQLDIQKLLVVRALVQAGGKIKDIAQLTPIEVREMLNSSRFRHLAHWSDWQDQELQNGQNRSLRLEQLMRALDDFDLDRLHHEFSKLALSTSPKVLALEIFAPLLRYVGQQTTQGQLSIAHEHALSALIDRHLNTYLNQRTHLLAAHQRPCVLLATPPGEPHGFGIKLASLICQEHAWREYNLGTELPLDALAKASQKWRPRVVVVGIATHFTKTSRRQAALLAYCQQLRRVLPLKTHLIVGGPNLQWSPELRHKSTALLNSLEEFDQFFLHNI